MFNELYKACVTDVQMPITKITQAELDKLVEALFGCAHDLNKTGANPHVAKYYREKAEQYLNAKVS